MMDSWSSRFTCCLRSFKYTQNNMEMINDRTYGVEIRINKLRYVSLSRAAVVNILYGFKAEDTDITLSTIHHWAKNKSHFLQLCFHTIFLVFCIVVTQILFTSEIPFFSVIV